MSIWRKLKVLPLDRWMRHADDEDLERYEPIAARLNRDGRYHYQGVTWFEVDGKGYLEPRSDDFLYVLKMADDRRLHPKELAAMQYLAYASADAVIRKRCWEHLRNHESAVALHNIAIDCWRARRRFNDFKKERGL